MTPPLEGEGAFHDTFLLAALLLWDLSMLVTISSTYQVPFKIVHSNSIHSTKITENLENVYDLQ